MNLFANKNWLTIEAPNVNLSEIEDKFIRAILRPLIDLAPYQSSFSLKIERYNSIYKAQISVTSPTRGFLSVAYDQKIYALTESLKADLLQQFEIWKQFRFLNRFDNAL